jgi:hypothetical protein
LRCISVAAGAWGAAALAGYDPVQNYGNEHWVHKTQLFPPGSGCH